MSYKARSYTQLYEWVNGNSIHNSIDNECCPDFSCCSITHTLYDLRVSYRDKFRREKRKKIIKKL